MRGAFQNLAQLQILNNLADDSRPNVTDKKPGEYRDSTKPSDNITKPARPSQFVTIDLSNSQIELNEVVGPSCTTKGNCVVTNSPDPQRESKLHTTILQPQRMTDNEIDEEDEIFRSDYT
nr:hypothetical protein [Tanacetum cinerariifolium]